ncbi:MAG: hypothetical protein JWR10_245 [Rubritepida sp.]|nr:hypothetical protein [Rubritepida sp.]
MLIQASRRQALLTAPLLISAGAAAQSTAVNAVEAAMTRFAAIDGTVSALVVVDDPAGAWELGHQPELPLFVGSVVKTFILAAYLLGVESGGLTLTEQLPVNDEVRSLVSPVLGELTGTMPARSVLEAMITHSDNTATDIAIKRVGVDAVRALIARAGVAETRVPDSTRRLFSYLAGAAPGQDLGWAGMEGVIADRLPGAPRPIINDAQTMAAPARALVNWYRYVLSGRLFAQPIALAEFRRISAMADAMAFIVPPDIAAYGKGGSVVWHGENALSVAGQMVIRGIPATFCFTNNWRGGPESMAPTTSAMIAGARDILAAVATRTG